MTLRFEVRALGVGEYSRPGLSVPFAVDAEFDVSLEDELWPTALGSVRVVFELRDLEPVTEWGRVYETRLLPVEGASLAIGRAADPAVVARLLDFAVLYLEGSARAVRVPGSPVPEGVLRVG